MIHQCNPPLWVTTPRGEGHCLFLIDYGPSVNTVWVVHLFETGAVTHIDSSEIRVMGNAMWGIPHPEAPERVPQHK
jgi:hypothetical protein